MFVLSEPIDLGDEAAEGAMIAAAALGELTINGITNDAAFALEAQLVDGLILVTADHEGGGRVDPAHGDIGPIATLDVVDLKP